MVIVRYSKYFGVETYAQLFLQSHLYYTVLYTRYWSSIDDTFLVIQVTIKIIE